MITSQQLRSYLAETFADFITQDVSQNGMQIQAPQEISRIAFAVDACQQSFDACVEADADLLIVHHGLFWRDIELVVDTHYNRLRTMIENQIGLYAMHLPLDAHNQIGNNVQLAAVLESDTCTPFIEEGGILLGALAGFSDGIAREELVERINNRLNTEATVLPFGPDTIHTLGIVSGGGGKYITDAVSAGCQAFLTGEPEHVVYHPAREEGITFIAGGHYATETVGLKALQRAIERDYDVETLFLDFPTGM